MAPTTDLVKEMTTIWIDEKEYPLVEIRSTGDMLLDVCFKNTTECIRAIPKDAPALRESKAKKLPLLSPRMFYRVRLETLKKHSEYFRVLFTPPFAEGIALADAFARLAASDQNPTEIEADKLPRVKIVDEDTATKTFGRETIFRDLLHIIHGATQVTSPFTTHCLTVLIIMADRYNTLPFITRHIQKLLLSHKYPVTLDKNGEEILRKKILIQYYTDQGVRFTTATKELILRGSIRWCGGFDTKSEYQTPWWDLPALEAELAYRRACVLHAVASIQMQFLSIYSSRDRQCKLGYDSSGSCDSFQLGEMVKFLSKKGLLSLVPFQAVSFEDPEYIWPEAYSGDIEYLIGVLRQCPSYQIDSNHAHCGLRSKLLPALDFIKGCIDFGLGVRLTRSKAGPRFDSWIPEIPANPKRSFWVGNETGDDIDIAGEKMKHFDFSLTRPKMLLGSSQNAGMESSAKSLFTAESWNWVTEPEGASVSPKPGLTHR